MTRNINLSLCEFLDVGREQWVVQRSFPARLFVRLFGPLGMHTRIRNTRVLNNLRPLTSLKKATILDAGCGHAYAGFWLARRYPGVHIDAIDADDSLIDAGRRIASHNGLSNISFARDDLTSEPRSQTYDLIISIDVLEHIVDDVAVLRSFRRALRPDGVLVLHVPRRHQEHKRLFRAFRAHTTPDHVRDEYTAPELAALMTRAHFSLESLAYGFGPCGEAAFELNNLFWTHPLWRIAAALLTFPLALGLAFLDTRHDYPDGNSLILVARPIPVESPE